MQNYQEGRKSTTTVTTTPSTTARKQKTRTTTTTTTTTAISSVNELTTSEEEMMSMNDELRTLNNELKLKVEELSRSSNDMKILLNSSNIATLFLDNKLNVRGFTPQIVTMIKLLSSDIGRPISDLVANFDYKTFVEDAHEVIRSLVFMEKEVPAHNGLWFRVRIMPYKTVENRIDGVVMTFFDISEIKRLQNELKEIQK